MRIAVLLQDRCQPKLARPGGSAPRRHPRGQGHLASLDGPDRCGMLGKVLA
ncbi:MAG: hypothetical protein QOG31_1198 [Thermoplasmata archaeon]|jgi:hypothetical protein|nr:hypothetical protein [Thermoplasmata archaeon]